MKNILEDEKFRDQLGGEAVNSINQQRIVDELQQLNIQDDNFRRALTEIDNVRTFIGSPNNILGNDATKHGEIAEQVEVGIRRARQALKGENVTANFDGVSRIASEDYVIDNIKIQSKFLNGTNNNLEAVLEHMNKYSHFGRDGSFYHIPKDDYEVIEKVINNETVEGLRLRTIESIKAKISQIEDESGKHFEEVVKPGISKYAEVQKGKIHQTLDDHQTQVSDNNKQNIEQISKEHQANIGEAIKATGVAAAVGASVSLTTSLYKKAKAGKVFYKGEFTADDWKEVGIDTVKGGAIGGVSGATIYGFTNYAGLSAPFAGAIVSATRGMNSLAVDLHNGKIDNEEFIELGMVVCSEAAIVGLATATGQAVIPVPILGAVVGSIAGTILSNSLSEGNKESAKMIQKDMDEFLKVLDNKHKILVNDIISEFKNLGELTEAAFNTNNNLITLNLSIDLALAYGVDDLLLLKTTDDIDSYMFK